MTVLAFLSAACRKAAAIARWIHEHLPEVWAHGHIALTMGGSTLLAVAPLYRETPNPWLVAGGIALSIAGAVWAVASAVRVGRMKKEMERALEHAAAVPEIIQAALITIADELELDSSQTRLSLYRHIDQAFVLVGRHSGSPRLKRPGRTRYPDDQGFIRQVWESGGSQKIKDLPSDRGEWNAACCEQFSIPLEVAAAMSMQARSLIGTRLDAPGSTATPIGVIIIESERPRGVTGTQLKKLAEMSDYVTVALRYGIHRLDERDSLAKPLPKPRNRPRRAA